MRITLSYSVIVDIKGGSSYMSDNFMMKSIIVYDYVLLLKKTLKE